MDQSQGVGGGGYSDEALPGVLGNRGKGHLFQGNKGQILRGTEEQKKIFGNREHKKFFFSIFWEQGNKPIYFRGTREQVPPLGGPL